MEMPRSPQDCCSARQFTQVFDNCTFDDGLGRVVSLNGAFALNTDGADVCTSVVPVGANFTASLSRFTHDVLFADGGFSRTFQDFSETFQVAPGGCTVRQPETGRPLGGPEPTLRGCRGGASDDSILSYYSQRDRPDTVIPVAGYE
jgi:hypothetical protein